MAKSPGGLKMDIKGKVAIITGAKRGIGKAIAIKLAKEGVNLALITKNKKGFEETIKELQTINPDIKIMFKTMDVSDSKKVESFTKKVAKEIGRIDILINNAGITRPNSIMKIAEKDWDLVINTNLKGPFLMMKYVIPQMIKNKWGYIVNINSTMAKQVYPYAPAYCASKFGLDGLSQSVKEEVRKYNIQITNIFPGAVNTDMWDDITKETDRSRFLCPDMVASSAIMAIKNSDSCTIDELIINPDY